MKRTVRWIKLRFLFLVYGSTRRGEREVLLFMRYGLTWFGTRNGEVGNACMMHWLWLVRRWLDSASLVVFCFFRRVPLQV